MTGNEATLKLCLGHDSKESTKDRSESKKQIRVWWNCTYFTRIAIGLQLASLELKKGNGIK